MEFCVRQCAADLNELLLEAVDDILVDQFLQCTVDGRYPVSKAIVVDQAAVSNDGGRLDRIGVIPVGVDVVMRKTFM